MSQTDTPFGPEQLTVIIPFHDASESLEGSLKSLFSVDSFNCPVVLVADGTSQRPAQGWIEDKRVTVVEMKERNGPAAARNLGVTYSKTDFLLFLDSDVMLPKETILRLKRFYDDGFCAGIALYAANPPLKTLSGRYKNSYMRFSYRQVAATGGTVPAFLTSAATCFRKTFIDIGGFDENYKKPSVEDADFGYKLRQSGVKINVIPELEISHLHHYSVYELLRTAFFRGAAVTRLSLRRPKILRGESERTSSSNFRLSLIPALLLCCSLLSSAIINGAYSLLMAFLFYCIIVLLNRDLLSAVRRDWDFRTAGVAFLLLPLDVFSHALGVLWGGTSYFLGQRY